ncbi:hypothetical protein NXY07_01480 [Phocaeicola dorei]|nr:hypothetical protein [Phocaeicola dorei]
MIWIEAGTPAMGNVFLNAYQLTGESYYLKAAQAAADALIWGQHSSGGMALYVGLFRRNFA